MMGEDDRGLVKRYLEILIDRGPPKTAGGGTVVSGAAGGGESVNDGAEADR